MPNATHPLSTARFDLAGVSALLGATLCWSVVPSMLRHLALGEHVPDGFTANLARYPLAALFYLPILIRGAVRGELRGFWLPALLPTAANLIMQTCWSWSPYFLPAGLLTFLLRLGVIWAIIGAFLVFPDERRLARNPRFWIGATLAGGGFIAMSWETLAGKLDLRPAGIAIIFGCGFFWAVYGVAVRYVMKGLNPLRVFSVISLYTAIGVTAMAPLGQPSALLDMNPREAGFLIASALLGIAVAHGLFYIAIKRLGVAVCSLGLMADPLVCVLIARITLGERLTALQWVGGFTLLAGAITAVLTQQRVRAHDVVEHEGAPIEIKRS